MHHYTVQSMRWTQLCLHSPTGSYRWSASAIDHADGYVICHTVNHACQITGRSNWSNTIVKQCTCNEINVKIDNFIASLLKIPVRKQLSSRSKQQLELKLLALVSLLDVHLYVCKQDHVIKHMHIPDCHQWINYSSTFLISTKWLHYPTETNVSN